MEINLLMFAGMIGLSFLMSDDDEASETET
jgi:hypothetical protein